LYHKALKVFLLRGRRRKRPVSVCLDPLPAIAIRSAEADE
jgi:hypothetical protein